MRLCSSCFITQDAVVISSSEAFIMVLPCADMNFLVSKQLKIELFEEQRRVTDESLALLHDKNFA